MSNHVLNPAYSGSKLLDGRIKRWKKSSKGFGKDRKVPLILPEQNNAPFALFSTKPSLSSLGKPVLSQHPDLRSTSGSSAFNKPINSHQECQANYINCTSQAGNHFCISNSLLCNAAKPRGALKTAMVDELRNVE